MTEQEHDLKLSPVECRKIICRFVDSEVSGSILEMVTPENFEKIFKNGLENLRGIRRQSNETLKTMTASELIKEKQQRHSRQHKIICAVNGVEDGRAFLEQFSKIKNSRKIPNKKNKIAENKRPQKAVFC